MKTWAKMPALRHRLSRRQHRLLQQGRPHRSQRPRLAQHRQILDDFKATFRSHAERSYNSTTRTWSVPLWCRYRLEEWADYWFAGDAQQWEDEEPAGYGYGGRTYSDTRSSYERCGKGQAGTSAIEAAFATLHLLPSAPPELVQAAHRALVKIHYPDRGGDDQMMVKLNLAMERIRDHQEEKAS